MQIIGTVTKVTRRVKGHGSVYLTVKLSRQVSDAISQPVTLRYLQTFETVPAEGQVVAISGVPLVGYKDSNIGGVSVRILEDVPTIKVRRAPLETRRGLTWIYDYTTPVDVTWTGSDGSVRPGPRAGGWIEYGTGLGALRDMLRRKHGRGVRITETWKAAA